MTQEEKDFLANYNPGDYPRPSVTADIVILTTDDRNHLNILLIRRGDHPYKGCYALPGGFLMAGQESSEESAMRELQEETGVKDVYLKQLYTFSKPDRDPRMHVVSIAYTALVPRNRLSFKADDDADDAKLFSVFYRGGTLVLTNPDVILTESDLAFDHAEIVKMAIQRLRNRIDYEPDAFELLQDKSAFTVYELRKAFEAIRGTELDPGNFRKTFTKNYLRTGYVSATGDQKEQAGAKPAMLYKVN